MALVAGGTRGAGRGIAVELGAAGATVYVTGRSTRAGRSEMERPETIEETAELVTARGGRGIAVRCDHTEPTEVESLVRRIAAEQDGRLDLLVNDVWGGDPLITWEKPVWEQPLDAGLRMLRLAVDTHIITSHQGLPLLKAGGLVVEITDGDSYFYRGHFFYDLVKTTVIRMAFALSQELASRGLTAVAVTPGFLRSEWMLDHFGVSEANWRDAAAKVPEFIKKVKGGEGRLMGFGHRVYKNYDPRAKIIKEIADQVFEVKGRNPLLDIALELERIALEDEYFIRRKLYPNVDFYSGLIYQSMGLPMDMFPVLFAIPRTSGWIAQWEEMLTDSDQKLARPKQLYLGAETRDYVPMEKRG